VAEFVCGRWNGCVRSFGEEGGSAQWCWVQRQSAGRADGAESEC
jgi:hypothetical protein